MPSLSPVSYWWNTMVTASSSWSVSGVIPSFFRDTEVILLLVRDTNGISRQRSFWSRSHTGLGHAGASVNVLPLEL